MFRDKKILVMGLGITGRACLKALNQMPCKVYCYDENKDLNLEDIEEDFVMLKDGDLENIDIIIKSPGIYPDHPLLEKARNLGIKIISDLEFAYKISSCKNLIAITGTNGKTTTTTLVGQILRQVNKTYVVGNIGRGISEIALEAKNNDFIVIEASSFQLEDTYEFKPKVALLTYVTKDHLDWHKTEDNYRNAKYKIFANQDKDDFSIINYDDRSRDDLKDLKSNIYCFSTEKKDIRGCFLDDGKIIFKDGDIREEIIDIKDIKIPGIHNVKNVMGAIIIAKIFNVSNDIIKQSIKIFSGVEHRIEFVKKVNGVSFYNDSKGTNPDSTLVAVKAMTNKTILIGGGYDKGSDFNSLMENIAPNLRSLIVFGQTGPKMAKEAKNYAIEVFIVKDLPAAVKLGVSLAKKGDSILLSPACASWDMYSSYEERGKHFKKIVKEL